MEQNQIPALPEYVCHKKVRAARIVKIGQPPQGSHMVPLQVELPDGATFQFPVSVEFIAKHMPSPGWYLVQYEDSYLSASPGPVFEAGYSRAPNPQPIGLPELEHLASMAQSADLEFPAGCQWKEPDHG